MPADKKKPANGKRKRAANDLGGCTAVQAAVAAQLKLIQQRKAGGAATGAATGEPQLPEYRSLC